jgi:hypothetical protein
LVLKAYFGVLVSVELVLMSPELFLLFLCLACFFFLVLVVVVPVSVEPLVVLVEVVVPVSVEPVVVPLEVLPWSVWANADNENVNATANSSVSSFFIP